MMMHGDAEPTYVQHRYHQPLENAQDFECKEFIQEYPVTCNSLDDVFLYCTVYLVLVLSPTNYLAFQIHHSTLHEPVPSP